VDHVTLLAALFFVTAAVYASVGQAGASGYLAAMALLGVAPDVMKPTALTLNVLVATIATVQFARSGHFSWRTLLPFAVGSVPFAAVGGAIQLPDRAFGVLVGIILLLSAALLLRRPRPSDVPRRVPLLPALGAGAVIGLLSGLTATGGAIFLSPLLVATGWADIRRAGGVSAAFILVNSLAGLAGNVASIRALPDAILPWSLAAGAGGLIGATLGSRYLARGVLYRILAVVLFIAGARLLASALV
jgi:uncharacterized membrane protein YfcA